MTKIKEELLSVIESFPIKPTFNKVIITLNSLTQDEDVILTDNVLSETQYVIAKGGFSNEVKVGDKVIIDIEKMMVPVGTSQNNAYEQQTQIKIDPIKVDGVMYAFIDDRLIKAVDNRE